MSSNGGVLPYMAECPECGERGTFVQERGTDVFGEWIRREIEDYCEVDAGIWVHGSG